ncbi:S41 family peptidase [Microbulbifer sp. PAAF003]|uniref:S41 family peptidase n=1 Tax=Microbulbifer sp. PAAF003 TaxID=3243375 RepID=UPI004039AD42
MHFRTIINTALLTFLALSQSALSAPVSDSKTLQISEEWKFQTNNATRNIISTSEGALAHIVAQADSQLFMTLDIDPSIFHKGPTELKFKIKANEVTKTGHFIIKVEDSGSPLYLYEMANDPVSGTHDWRTVTVSVPRLSKATNAMVGYLMFSSGEVWLGDVQLLQDKTETELNTSYDKLKEYALSLIKDHYILRDTIDITEFEQFADDVFIGVQNDDQADAALTALFSKLNHRHLTILNRAKTSAHGETRQQKSELSLVGNNTALISLPKKFGSETAQQEEFARTSALIEKYSENGVQNWIIDLREQPGGDLIRLFNLTRQFFSNQQLFSYQLVDGSERFFWLKNGSVEFGTRKMMQDSLKPGDDTNTYHRPLSEANVILLVSDYTGSAAEMLAQAFSDRENTILIGSETAGLMSTNKLFKFTNGTKVAIPMGQSTSIRGELVYKVQPDINTKPDEALNVALKYLEDNRL